jgi:hypothetical protein
MNDVAICATRHRARSPSRMSKSYHRARIDHTCVALRAFLEAYEPNAHDEELEDPVTWVTQNEYFAEAQGKLQDIVCPAAQPPTLRGIMLDCPVVCRTLTVRRTTVCGIRMNPWLVSVITMPNVVRLLSTSDYLRFEGKQHGSEIINSAMLVTRDPRGSILSTGAGKHIQSYLLCGSDELYHPDADLATWAMVVAHLLTQPDQQSWMAEELERICFLHHAVYRDPTSSWRKYLALVRSDDFRLALVTQSRELEPWMQCPHINKFALAVFLLKDKLTVDELEARRNAAILELFGRMYKPKLLPYMFRQQFTTSVDAVLRATQFTLKPTLRETIQLFMARLKQYDFRSVPLTLVDPNQDTFRSTHLNWCCATLKCFFSRLHPSMPDLDDPTWLKLFTTGLSISDSYRRNTAEGYQFDREKLMSHFRSALEDRVLLRLPLYVFRLYWAARGNKTFPFDTAQHYTLFLQHWKPIVMEFWADPSSAPTP